VKRADNVIVLADHLRPRSQIKPLVWAAILTAGALLAAYLEVRHG
jgi:hypothetical protein